MAHEIFGERFVSRREPAWHGLGRVYPEDWATTPEDAVKEVTGGIVIEGRPIHYQAGDGSLVLLPGQQAIVRGPTAEEPQERIFGVVSGRWDAVSYPKLAAALNELGQTYRVETAGLLQHGSLCFLALRGPDFGIKGDDHQLYFVLNLSCQPGVGHNVKATPIRVVCWNTNVMADSAAVMRLSIPHCADAEARLKLAGQLVARFAETKERTEEILRALADAQASAEDIERIIDAAYPLPAMPPTLRLIRGQLDTTQEVTFRNSLDTRALDKLLREEATWERGTQRVQLIREAAHERFEAFVPATLRGTLYAAYNAVTEVSDWREGRGADVASLWGARAGEKARAFTAAMECLN